MLESINFDNLNEYFRDEDSARQFLEKLRWSDGVECPYCESKKVYKLTPTYKAKTHVRKGVYKCGDCQQQFTKRLQVFGIGESAIQQKINNTFSNWPKEIGIGFRAGFPTLELKLNAKNKNDIQKRNQCEQDLKKLFGGLIFGENNDSLASVLVTLLTKNNLKITCAESCTGGLISSQITSIPGS